MNLCGFGSCPQTTQQVSYQQLQLHYMRSFVCVQDATKVFVKLPALQPLRWATRSLAAWQGGSSVVATSQGEP